MEKVLVVFGYGVGVSKAVAEKFGAEGFAIALVARNRERVEAAAAALQAKGVQAAAFPADLSQPAEIHRVVEAVRARFGAITVLEWTAYDLAAGDVLAAKPEELRAIFDLPVVGLATAVQAALPDLKTSPNAAVLITNGNLAIFDPQIDQMGVDWNVMGLSIANSAKHKLSRLLAIKLQAQGIYVGEVTIMDVVKGTAFDQGSGKIEASSVAAEFWRLYAERKEHFSRVG